MLRLGKRKLVWVEELPYRPIDDLIRCMTEDVDYRVGRVQDVCIIREVCVRQKQKLGEEARRASVPWMVMKVVSMSAGMKGGIADEVPRPLKSKR